MCVRYTLAESTETCVAVNSGVTDGVAADDIDDIALDCWPVSLLLGDWRMPGHRHGHGCWCRCWWRWRWWRRWWRLCTSMEMDAERVDDSIRYKLMFRCDDCSSG